MNTLLWFRYTKKTTDEGRRTDKAQRAHTRRHLKRQMSLVTNGGRVLALFSLQLAIMVRQTIY